jgi:hypothetical protein
MSNREIMEIVNQVFVSVIAKINEKDHLIILFEYKKILLKESYLLIHSKINIPAHMTVQ